MLASMCTAVRLFVLFQIIFMVIEGHDVDVFLLRHVESVYNQDAAKAMGQLRSSILNPAFHDSEKDVDSPVSKKGTEQLNAINQFFGTSILNQQKLLDILSGGPIELESSTLRRAQFTALFARNSLYDAIKNMVGNKQKSLEVLQKTLKTLETKPKPHSTAIIQNIKTTKENIHNKNKQITQLTQVKANLQTDSFMLIRDLQEEQDLIHTDSKSKCDKTWFSNPDTIDQKYKDYLRDGLFQPKSGDKLNEKMYLGQNIHFKYVDHIGAIKEKTFIKKTILKITGPSTEEELIGYAQHLKDAFKAGIKVFIAGAHSQWIRHFINKYKSGTDAGLKLYSEEKVPNGAALHLVIQIPEDPTKDIKITYAKLYNNHGVKTRSGAHANYEDLLEAYYDLVDLYDLDYDLYDKYGYDEDDWYYDEQGYMDYNYIEESDIDELMGEIMGLMEEEKRLKYEK